MRKTEWKDLRKKLPYQYCRLISAKLTGISLEQVRMVFEGRITNPTIVSNVLTEAKNLIELYKNFPVSRKKKLRKKISSK